MKKTPLLFILTVLFAITSCKKNNGPGHNPPTVDSLKIGLIAYYPFNDNAVDSSGNGNNGSVNGATPTTDRFGHANSAYYFNGTSSYIAINDNTALRLNNTNFTLNMWVQLDTYNAGSGSALLSKNNGADQNGWNCSIVGYGNQNGGKAGNLFYNVSGGTDPYVLGVAVVDTIKWNMLTITYNNSAQTISFYVNGIFDKSQTNIPTPNATTNAKLHIGNNSLTDIEPSENPYFINGKMDDIRIYDRLLPLDQITKLYTITN